MRDSYDPMELLESFRPIVEGMNGCVAMLVANGYPEDLAREYVLRLWITDEDGDDDAS